jgi:AmiR/NasT family two-component response regulator
MASQLADGRDGVVEVAATEREERLAELVVALADENANLQRALDTRIVIEQAKGVLAERLGVGIEDAFEVLRGAARSHQAKLHDLAAAVVGSRETPAPVRDWLARRA